MTEKEPQRHSAEAAGDEEPTSAASLQITVSPIEAETSPEGEVPQERDTAYYAEVRESVGGGTPTLLLGTSTRSLDRSLAKLRAAQARLKGEKRRTSRGTQEEVSKVAEVRYEISRTRGRWSGGRSLTVTFFSSEGCESVHVRVVALPGKMMPASAEGAVVLFETTLALEPGVPAEYHVAVPQGLRPPYWVRCFVVDGEARLIDPPVSSLLET